MASKVASEISPLRIIPPAWMRELVHRRAREAENGDIHFVMEKTVGHSDCCRHKGRFILPADCNSSVLRLLSPSQRIKFLKTRVRKRPRAEGKKEKPKYAKLKLKVFVRSGWMFHLDLARNCRDDTVMIKGSEWKCVLASCNFRENDAVEMWAFRCRLPPPPSPTAGAASSNSSSDRPRPESLPPPPPSPTAAPLLRIRRLILLVLSRCALCSAKRKGLFESSP